MQAALTVLAAALTLACDPPKPAAPMAKATLGTAGIVTTERGPRGARLVFLDEHGVRLADLTQSEAAPTLDSHPSWSPDGKVILFARATDEHFDRSRLFAIEATLGATPRQLSAGTARQRDPRWFPGGRAVLYAADDSGSFDLYRQRLAVGADRLPRPSGRAERLTTGAGQELSPSIAADGQAIAFMEISADGEISRIRALSLPGGEVRSLTAGPLDVTPAFNPEKPRVLAYASRADGRNDMDLFLLDVETGEQSLLPPEPMADLTGPVWSIDGRHLFATAVFRSVATGDAILSSVVVVDTFSSAPRWRALHDPAFTESRVGVALAPRAFLPSLIDANQPYGSALGLAIEQHLIRRPDK